MVMGVPGMPPINLTTPAPFRNNPYSRGPVQQSAGIAPIAGQPPINLTPPNPPAPPAPPSSPYVSPHYGGPATSSDPFAKWLFNATKPLSYYDEQAHAGNIGMDRYNLLRDDPKYAWSQMLAPFGIGSAPGGIQRWMANQYQRVLDAYNQADFQGTGPYNNFYDYARNYDFGNKYYMDSAANRGYALGGGPASGRILKSY